MPLWDRHAGLRPGRWVETPPMQASMNYCVEGLIDPAAGLKDRGQDLRIAVWGFRSSGFPTWVVRVRHHRVWTWFVWLRWYSYQGNGPAHP
jgi:hypothetical protein